MQQQPQSIQLSKQQHLTLAMLGVFVGATFDQAVAQVRAEPINPKYGKDLVDARDLMAQTEALAGQAADPATRAMLLDSLAVLAPTEWAATIAKAANPAPQQAS